LPIALAARCPPLAIPITPFDPSEGFRGANHTHANCNVRADKGGNAKAEITGQALNLLMGLHDLSGFGAI